MAEQLTAQQLLEAINDLALNGEGADRRWALKVLREETQTETAFQKPLNDQEVVERLARLMRGAGMPNTRAAYVKAYGNYTGPDKPLDVSGIDIDIESLPKTLKQYYNRYPEFKKHGYPEGYPLKDPVKQMIFVQKLSMLREKERMAAHHEQAISHINHVQDLATDGAEKSG